MTLMRPEVIETLYRWREVLAGLAGILLGLWLARIGGLFFLGVGVLVMLAAASVALIGYRRRRFMQHGVAPGVVQVVEGQVAYFGPEQGGFVALGDLATLKLARGGADWVLEQEDGTALVIPVAARGADALYDSFATLPGLDMQHLLSAMARADTARAEQVLWRRHRDRPALT